MATDLETGLVLRLEATLAKFEKQMSKARAVTKTQSTGMQRDMDRLNASMAASSGRAATALSRVINVSGRGRFVLQNTANQIGDVAVQLQGGTAAAKVFAQQMPQLLGGFGALGGALGLVAPLLGTMVAIGIPVAAMLLSNGEAADKAKEKVQTFAEALSNAQGALSRAESALGDAANGNLEDLLQKYGEVTQAVRTLNSELAMIEVRAAATEVRGLLDSVLGANLDQQIEDKFGNVGQGLIRALTEMESVRLKMARVAEEIQSYDVVGADIPVQLTNEWQKLSNQITDLEGRFAKLGEIASRVNVSPQMVSDLNAVAAAIRAAVEESDFDQVSVHLADLRELAAQIGLPQGFIDQLSNAEDLALQLGARMDEAAALAEDTSAAAGGIGPALQSGVSAAAAMAQNLGISLATAQRLAALGPQGVPTNGDPSGNTYSGRGGDPRQFGGTAFEWQTTDAANWTPPKTSKGGSRGGSSGGDNHLEKLTREYEALRGQLDPTFRSFQRLTDAQTKLKEAYDAGLISQADYTDLMRKTEEQFGQTANAMQEYAQQMGDFLGDLAVTVLDNIDNVEDLKKAVADFARQAARDLLKLAISKGFQALLNLATGGIGGSLFGGAGVAGGGGIGFRASGGPVSAGQPYIVGEKRPELFVPNTSGTILPSVPSGGATAEFNVNIIGNLPSGAVRQGNGRVDIDMARLVNSVIESGGADAGMRARFGASPRGSGA